MQAKITKKIDGCLYCIVRRGYREEQISTYGCPHLYKLVKIGDRVEVERVTNNPYLRFIETVVK
jgi:hypothetical protein